MDLSQITRPQAGFGIIVLLMLAAGIAVLFSIRKRKTQADPIEYGGP